MSELLIDKLARRLRELSASHVVVGICAGPQETVLLGQEARAMAAAQGKRCVDVGDFIGRPVKAIPKPGAWVICDPRDGGPELVEV